LEEESLDESMPSRFYLKNYYSGVFEEESSDFDNYKLGGLIGS
jgi:hypothetical protein